MIEERLRRLWDQLQSKKLHLPHFLTGIGLEGIRGFKDLRVGFDFPVSVIAGGNATGKSTVLFAAACAYKVPGTGPKDYVPSSLFPDYRPKVGEREDEKTEIVLEFNYKTPQGPNTMLWKRAKGWNRSFLGRRKTSQPERPLYLRTLSNLSNPSELRGVLSMSRLQSQPDESPMTASQVEFAHQMLPFRYSEVVDLSSGKKKLLFAAQESGANYSELHMAAGERAILRLAQEIAQLNGALILIDEVEAGLHPWMQQLLMLQLQQLALRNDLQVIVTSHSPVVLDSVPQNGRIFLERDESGRVSVGPPYRDIVQNALYGRSRDALNLLCEDDAAEGILLGVVDFLQPRLRFRGESIRIGKDTGASEFHTHAKAFGKFGQLQNFVFALDGDKRGTNDEKKLREEVGRSVRVFFLPGSESPEAWVWDKLRHCMIDEAKELGMDQTDLQAKMNSLGLVFDSLSDTASVIAKHKLQGLADYLSREVPEICRAVARWEAKRLDSEIQTLVEELEDAINDWRSR